MKKVINKMCSILVLLSALFAQTSFSLTAELYIENIHSAGDQFLWEIHFRPVSGWTGGALNGNSYLLNASYYFKYNSAALSAPVLTYQNPIVQGHYNNTAGIAGGRVYASTADIGDPQQVTEGVKYHLYTVAMTVIDSGALFDLEWDTINTAVENFSGAVAAGSDLRMIPPWSADVTVTGSITQVHTFGGNADATDGYDSGFDMISPPPAMNYYSYFSLPAFPNFLSKDIRRWVSPYAEVLTWELVIVNAEEVSSTATWDPSQLPPEGRFTLSGTGTVDMRTSSSVTFSGNKILILSYNPVISVSYTFEQAGWYLLSLPVVPQDSTVSSLFPYALGGQAFIWNPANGTYETVTKMRPGKGYWLAIPSASSNMMTGVPLKIFTEHFSAQGWYMIGSVHGGTDFTNPDDNPDGSVSSPAFSWDQPAAVYVQTVQLNEKQGYWAAVFAACDLTVGAAGGMCKPAAAANRTAFYQKYGNGPPGPPNIDWNTGKLIEIPDEYFLRQNYPNPFNESTVIEIGLPEKGSVELIIIDLLGRQICRLVNNIMNPGYHQINWNGINDEGQKVSSGLYFYMLRTKEFTKTKKLLVIK